MATQTAKITPTVDISSIDNDAYEKEQVRIAKVLALIQKAESNRVAKRKIIKFLKKKGISDLKIIQGYEEYYKEEKLYEITFVERPLGFSVIMDTRGKNAIISSIQDPNIIKSGLKMASRMYEVNGKRVDGLNHKEILDIVASCQCPFYVVFKESIKDDQKLQKLQQRAQSAWVEPTEANDSDASESSNESYSSDDDVRHVEQHYKRKQKQKQKVPSKNNKGKRKSRSKGVFKPEEIGMWNDIDLDAEKGEMFKELAKLMVSAAVSHVPTEDPTLQAMSQPRKATLTKLVDSTPKDNRPMTFEPSELLKDEEEEESTHYDPEILKYLHDLMGLDEKRRTSCETPSTSSNMNKMWSQVSLTHDERGQSMDLSHLDFDENGNNKDVLSQMKEGTTLLKHQRYGGRGYRTFRLSEDHKYLVWFSQKKDVAETRIPIKEIVEIKIGKESDVVRRIKEEEVHETSFTVIYGKDGKQLNVTAKSPKEAYVWAQGLKILADAAKRGTNISDLTSLEVRDDEPSKTDRSNSVVISMGHVRSQSVMNMFHKNNDASTKETLVKRHAQLKLEVQRYVDFVMNKKNYKIIKSKGEFQNVKTKLEQIDGRLKQIKTIFEHEDITKDLSGCKAELFSVAADLDALKQMLTALVRQQKKL